jgi:hypothetical protein
MEAEAGTYNQISMMISLKICTMKGYSGKDDINYQFYTLSFNALFYRSALAHLPLFTHAVYASRNPSLLWVDLPRSSATGADSSP